MTRQAYDEWTWRHNGYIASGKATRDRADAERGVAAVRRNNPDGDVALVHRTVTDWQDVSDGEAAK